MKLFRTILSVMTIASIMATGCNNIEKTTITNIDTETTDEKEENHGKDDYKYISEYEEEKLDLENYSLDYVFETDAQTFFLNGECTKTENGYYVWGRGEYCSKLCFIDSRMLEMVPVCNRPDCLHTDSDCNAHYNDLLVPGEYYDHNYIQYYDGYVYIIGTDGEYENLYRISPDGTTCEKYMSLYRVDLSPEDKDSTNPSYTTPSVWIHRGYVYYIDNKEKYPKLRRMKLGSDEVEVVYETGGEGAVLFRMMPYGDYLFFQTGNIADADTIDCGIMAYNINTGEVKLVKKNIINSYGFVNGRLYYYKDNKEVRVYSLEENTDSQLCEIEGLIVFFNEKYIYVCDGNIDTVTVYDYDGKLLGSIKDEYLVECWFGDDKYVLSNYSPSIGVATTVIVSVDDIIAGKGEWKILE